MKSKRILTLKKLRDLAERIQAKGRRRYTVTPSKITKIVR